MSTWTGGNTGSDDAYSDTQCRWQMCTTLCSVPLPQREHVSVP